MNTHSIQHTNKQIYKPNNLVKVIKTTKHQQSKQNINNQITKQPDKQQAPALTINTHQTSSHKSPTTKQNSHVITNKNTQHTQQAKSVPNCHKYTIQTRCKRQAAPTKPANNKLIKQPKQNK